MVGGLSIGRLVAANASPPVGIAIHRHEGRPVLASAALLVIGLETGCGLYDPAFATLERLHGAEARSTITT